MRNRILAVAALALFVYAADQASKYWILEIYDLPTKGSVPILPFFNLSMVWNPGVTFGLFRAEDWPGRLVLEGATLAIVGYLLYWLTQKPSPLVIAAIGVILGGAAGNFQDRLRFGAVVDFLHFHAFGYSWYVFNLADAAIVGGGIAIGLDALFGSGAQATKSA